MEAGISRPVWYLSCVGLCMGCGGGDGSGLDGDSGGLGSLPDASIEGAVGGPDADASPGSLQNSLAVRVEDTEGLEVEVVTLSCRGDCADIVAIASGGNPPYEYTWENGETDPERTVCLDASTTLSVEARDTALDLGEFRMESQTARAEVSAKVTGCEATCEADAELGLPERLSPDLYGEPTYFHDGEPLPAGRYRLTYIDGCLRYDPEWGWTVQDLAPNQFLLIGEGPTDLLGVPPAQTSLFPLTQADFEECVAANRQAASPLELDFDGGRLGIWQNDFKPEDNVPGIDGRSPTWELSRICD